MLRKLFCKFIKILLLFIPGSFWNGHEWDNIRNISLNLRLHLTLKLRVLLSTEMECLRGSWWGSQPAMTFFLVLRVVFALTHTHPPHHRLLLHWMLNVCFPKGSWFLQNALQSITFTKGQSTPAPTAFICYLDYFSAPYIHIYAF